MLMIRNQQTHRVHITLEHNVSLENQHSIHKCATCNESLENQHNILYSQQIPISKDNAFSRGRVEVDGVNCLCGIQGFQKRHSVSNTVDTQSFRRFFTLCNFLINSRLFVKYCLGSLNPTSLPRKSLVSFV